ncbi:hypothetical protein [Actinospica robiniae]|uniref:SnoaL-like domain-containing protein n=1 Tax=Actinospica robiniae DSM 44927 TaxID=479430 RepID=W9DZY5_9ACTN|nr:hypothetical protein [Actinospica robiniae]ETA71165.1 hypothetical protein ActroDRAFT_0194 [Actinospica robiniae DSM 44927]
MTDSKTELQALMAEYERATSTRDINQVIPLICAGATYRFTWTGRVDGRRRSEYGRGTNMIAKQRDE